MLGILLTALLLTVQQPKEVGYIYLGDSRFVGMEKVCEVSEEENVWVVAKVGKGLNWCKNTAMPTILSIVDENPDIDEWVLISGLGINDTYNADRYIQFYMELEGFDIVLCSVNPVEEAECVKHGYNFYYLDAGISTMNAKLQETDFTYIDVNSYLIENGFNTVDGVHYSADTYTGIYEYIKGELEVIRRLHE